MADVVAVMARLDGDAGGLQKAASTAEKAYDTMVKGIESGSEEAVSSAKDMSDKSGSAFEDMSKKAVGAFAAITAGAGVIGAAFDQVNIKGTIAAQFDGTPEEVGAISKATQDAYNSGWGESMDEVAKTATGLQQTLKNVGQSGDISNLTEQAQALSKTFDVDTTESIAGVRSMLSSGLAPDAQSAFDIITKGMQSGANSSGDLIDTLTEYPAQFQKLGIGGSTAIGLINQGLASGARNSDLVADALKEFSIRAVDGSQTTAQGFQMLGLNAKEMTETMAKGGASAAGGLQETLDKLRGIQDPAKRSQAAVALFGTQAEDLGKSLYSLDPSKATKAMGDVAGAGEKMANNTMSVQQQMTGLFRTMMGSIGKALTPLVPVLQDVMKQLAPIFGQLGDAVGPVVAALAPIFASLVKAIMPIVTIIGSQLAPIMNEVAPIAQQLGSVIGNALVTVLNQLTPIMPPLIQAFVSILAAVGPLLQPIVALASAFTPLIVVIAQMIGQILPPLVQLFTALLGPILKLITPLIGMLVPAISAVISIISTVITWIVKVIATAVSWASNVSGITKSIGAAFSWLWNNGISPAINAIRTAISGVGSFIGGVFGTVSDIVHGVGDTFSRVFGAIGGYVSNAFSGIVSAIRGPMNGVIRLVNGAIGALNNIHVTLPDFLGGGSFGINLPKIPMLARGGTAIADGLAVVGERGPELITLPAGASVIPSYPSKQALQSMAGGTGGSGSNVSFHNTFNVQNVDEQGLVDRVGQTIGWQLEQAGATQ